MNLYKLSIAMKTVVNSPKVTWTAAVLMIAGLLVNDATSAQSPTSDLVASTARSTSQAAYPAATGSPSTGRSYWRVFTSPDSRTSTIRFYDNDQQLLYEETLAGRYLILSRKNVDRLDKVLAQLTSNQLLASNLKTTESPQSNQVFGNRASKNEAPSVAEPGGEPQRPAGPYAEILPIGNSTKVVVRMLNPTKGRMAIFIRDERGNEVYREIVTQPAYNRHFDLKPLPLGHYTVVVTNHDGKFLYERPFQLTSSTALLVSGVAR